MSIRIMTAVWQLTLPHVEKLVLLALADNASDEGKCFPKIKTLTEKCSLSERTVQGAITRLADAGHVTRHERAGHSTVYSVHPRMACTPAADAPPRAVRPAADAPTPAADAPLPPQERRGTPARRAPITVIEPSIEPSLDHARASVPREAQREGNGKDRKPTPAEKVDGAMSDYESFQRIKAVEIPFRGRQDWIHAQHQCHLRIDEGQTWQSLLESWVRYATYIAATGSYAVTPGKYFAGSDADAYWRQTWAIPEQPRARARVTGAMTHADLNAELDRVTDFSRPEFEGEEAHR